MFVRTASLRDLDAVRALVAETWHDTYDAIYGSERVTDVIAEQYNPKRLKAWLDEPGSEFLVADDGKTIAGMAFASAVEGGREVIWQQLLVRPALQGRGIGTLLLDEIESSFPEAERFRLNVENANSKAVAFYLSHAYVVVSQSDNEAPEDMAIATMVMEKQVV